MCLKKIRVALVDDNDSFLCILRDYLSQKEEIEVVGIALNGLEAIELIKTVEPDIVILDIIMPHLSGLGVLEKINLYMANKPLFIILSAIGEYKTTQIAFAKGAEFYMIKPFDMEELVSRIKQLYYYKNLNEVKKFKPQNLNSILKHNKTNLKENIENFLISIGMPTHLKGYQYLVQAIAIVIEDLTVINSITKQVYSNVASKYKTTPERVERSIRNAIELTWAKGNIDNIDLIFGFDFCNEKTKPSNSEFLIKVANKFLNKQAI